MGKLKPFICGSLIFVITGCQTKVEDVLDNNYPTTITIWHYYNGV